MSLQLGSRLTASANTLRAGATAATSSLAKAPATFICNQCRTAILLRRPKRPYTFTQLIALSDGSTFLHRTTSPVPVYRSTRDTRNAPEWNPSNPKFSNTENDEAGQLAAFRSRFGGAWDSSVTASAEDAKKSAAAAAMGDAAVAEKDAAADVDADPYAAYQYDYEEDDNLLDLITGFGQGDSKKK
ncbi:guanine nucleotide exchange factor 10-like protein [Ascosphaera pollenicola]|nr:guanine nucleotide exchange factor 10-like protein [Ascosphaera pollenicola]